jgi:enamine deaminase RidA (YjgF/YER057c/UK114 family)
MRKTIVGPDLGENLDGFDDGEGVDGLPHSEAVVVELPDYTRVFIAGTGPLDGDENLVAPGDPVAQIEAILETIDSIVTVAGGDRRDIVRMNLVTEPLTPDEHRGVSAARHRFIPEGHEPASTTVVTDQVGLEGMRLEMDADAIIPRDGWEVETTSRNG